MSITRIVLTASIGALLSVTLAAVLVRAEEPATTTPPARETGEKAKELGRTIGEAGRDVGRELGEAGRTIGREAGEAGREIGKAGKEVGLEIAAAAKKVWFKGKEVSAPLLEEVTRATRAFWDDVIDGKDRTLEALRRENEELRRRLRDRETK